MARRRFRHYCRTCRRGLPDQIRGRLTFCARCRAARDERGRDRAEAQRAASTGKAHKAQAGAALAKRIAAARKRATRDFPSELHEMRRVLVEFRLRAKYGHLPALEAGGTP
jgi:hypothetical protein